MSWRGKREATDEYNWRKSPKTDHSSQDQPYPKRVRVSPSTSAVVYSSSRFQTAERSRLRGGHSAIGRSSQSHPYLNEVQEGASHSRRRHGVINEVQTSVTGQGHSSGRITQLTNSPGHKKDYGFESSRPVVGKEASTLSLQMLKEFLKKDPDTVIQELGVQDGAYFKLTNDPRIDTDILTAFIPILGQKICADSSLNNLRNPLIAQACSSSFLIQLKDACLRLLLGDFANADSINNSLSVLKNMQIFYQFVAEAMPHLAADTLVQNIIDCILVLNKYIATSTCPDGMRELHAKFLGLQQDIEEFKKRREVLATESATRNGNGGIPKFKMSLAEKELRMLRPPPNDFRGIPVIPTPEELFESRRPFLRPALETGKYPSVDQYLDVQYRLLREDFVAPLRDGIQYYLQNRHGIATSKKRTPLGTVRIYKNVRVRSGLNFPGGSTVTQALELEMNYLRNIKWDKSKRLLPGSLLLLTRDDFESIHFAIVARRDPAALRNNGTIDVTWEVNKPAFHPSYTYLMLECEVYFEVYRHVLLTLKDIRLQNYPLARYIVDASVQQNPPLYMQDIGENVIDIGSLMTRKPDDPEGIPIRTIEILNKSSWPTAAEIGMDESQFEAFQAALTTEFAIIQGPPGTGKTFIGIQIAKFLLANSKYFLPNSEISEEPPPTHTYIQPTSPQFVGMYNARTDESNETTAEFDEYTEESNKTTEEPNKTTDESNKSTEKSDETTEEPNETNRRPVTIVCYTNHALDQFLEAIVDLMEEMGMNPLDQLIRVGNQTKSDRLKDLGLYKRMEIAIRDGNLPSDYLIQHGSIARRRRYLTFRRYRLMDALKGLNNLRGIIDWGSLLSDCFHFTSLTQIVNKKEGNDGECANPRWGFVEKLISSKYMLGWMGMWIEPIEYGNFNENDFMRSMFRRKHQLTITACRSMETAQSVQEIASEEDINEDEEYDLEEILANRIEEIHFESDAAHETRYNLPFALSQESSIDKIRACERQIGEIRREAHGRANMDEIHNLKIGITRWRNMGELVNSVTNAYRSGSIYLEPVTDNLLNKVLRPSNPSPRSPSECGERWAVYFYLVEKLKELLALEIVRTESDLVEIKAKSEEVERIGHAILLQRAKFVGMTTSGAAKNSALVRQVQSQLIIVEEAAEVLESQIITSISEHCRHLILIGDHRQLRPHTTVYRLAKDYKLDVSLFERMVNNGLNTHVLKIQHRMRPEICELIVPTIYPNLLNHPSVNEYPHILGVTSSVYFVTHTEVESAEMDSISKTNDHEAAFLVQLCRYLILQGYSANQITILTTYIGQMFKIKTIIRDVPVCLGVRVSVVDNFQGEENDIILLSLVRSNPENKIGFLKTDNRICVAISRAKQGFYIIGNMDSLTKSSETWQKINDTLLRRGNVGNKLTLKCQIHGVLTQIATTGDFYNVPEGGCSRMCETGLDCGHLCTQMCHGLDANHQQYKCEFLCKLSCPAGHGCVSKCSIKPCPPCLKTVDKTLTCGHKHRMRCFTKESDFKCSTLTLRTLACNHVKELQCWEDHIAYKCEEKVMKSLPCGHQQISNCFEIEPDILCVTNVLVKVKDCGHDFLVDCHRSLNPASWECITPCDTRLTCGHSCIRKCHTTRDPQHKEYKCNKDCAKDCPLGHPCVPSSGNHQHKCHAVCPLCEVWIEEKLKCGHIYSFPCYQTRIREYITAFKCEFPCTLTLPCGHKCKQKCHEDCGPCRVPVKKKSINCSHEITVSCSQEAEKGLCNQYGDACVVSLCGHSVKVPCRREDTITAEECMAYCKEPCDSLLFVDDVGCEHKCTGSCSLCFQGRIHVKCSSNCGRILVCGHRCTHPCSALCPPCKANCEMKCKHSKCKQLCGKPCSSCKEPCTFSCEHSKCTKLCGQECNRVPCSEPCKIILECGHPCVGLCGDPCPPLCRICDTERLTEYQLLCTEDEEDARFVYLEDCGHTIEKEGLDMHMKSSVVEGGIIMKKCPRCTAIIWNSERYWDVIKRCLQDVASAKRKIFGDSGSVVSKRRKVVRELISLNSSKSLEPDLQQFRDYLQSKTLSNYLEIKNINQYELQSIDYMLAWMNMANQNLRQAQLSVQFKKELEDRYQHIFRILEKRQLPLSALEIKQVEQEMDRLSDFWQLCRRASVPDFATYSVNELFNEAKSLVNNIQPYDSVSKQQLSTILKNIDAVLKTKLDDAIIETREVFKAISFGASWYKCPNGHFYQIGDCGLPNQVFACPDCKLAIGSSGVQHVAAAGNIRVAEKGQVPQLPAKPDFLN